MAVKPVVYDDSSNKHRPLGSGEKMDGLSASSIISSDSGNLIGTGSDGLAFISGPGIADSAADNLLEATPAGKLKVDIDRIVGWLDGHPSDAKDFAEAINVVSGDSGNLVREGTDGGAYMSSAQLAPAIADGLTVVPNSSGRLSVGDISGVAVAASGASAERALGDRFADFANLKDFGAAGDGAADDTGAWTAWRSASEEGAAAFAPAGEYLVNGESYELQDGCFGNCRELFSVNSYFAAKNGKKRSQAFHHGRWSGNNPEPVAEFSNVIRPASAVPSEDVLVVVIAGASNAAGYAAVGAATESFKNAGKFWHWCDNDSGTAIASPSWEPLAEPNSPTSRNGMDVSLGLALHELSEKPVYVINVAKGASALNAGEAWTWNVNGNCRAVAQTQINAALAAVTASGLTYRLMGVVWVQREAMNVISGDTTLAQFKIDQQNLNAWFYSTFGVPKIWSAECNYSAGQTDAEKAIIDDGNEVLREVAGADGRFILATRRYLTAVPSEALHDGTHFTSVWYRRFGYDFAHAIYVDMVGSAAVSDTESGTDAAPAGLHAKAALAGSTSLEAEAVAGSALHVCDGGEAYGVHGVSCKSCKSGGGQAIGVYGRGETAAPDDSAGTVAGGKFEVVNWSFGSEGGQSYQYESAPFRCGVLVKSEGYGSAAEAGVAVVGANNPNHEGFWNGLWMSWSVFRNAGGKAGTTGLNLGAFAGDNYPEVGIKLGKCGTHVRCIDSSLAIEAPTTQINARDGDTACVLKLNGLSTSPSQISFLNEGTRKGYLLWRPYTETTDHIRLRLTDGDTIKAGVTLSNFSFYGIGPDDSTHLNLGNAGDPWDTVFATTGSIDTSDERLKDNVEAPSDALMRAWGKVGFVTFQFRDALAKKGEAARIHVGVIAQRIIEAFASEGLDATRYGLLCYDEWEAEPEVWETREIRHEAVVDETTGETLEEAWTETAREKISETKPAGSRYGVRYEEALALECAYQRWRLEQIEARLDAAGRPA